MRFLRLTLRRRIVPSIILLVCLLNCTGKNTKGENEKTVNEISILDQIKLKDMDDRSMNLVQYQGKAIFINFWATWCGPCIKEMPSIERARNILKDSNIEFLIASNETIEQIQSFIAKRNLDLHYVQLQNMEELGVPALPTTYIINPKGELVFSETGSREWDAPVNIELLTQIIEDHD